MKNNNLWGCVSSFLDRLDLTSELRQGKKKAKAKMHAPASFRDKALLVGLAFSLFTVASLFPLRQCLISWLLLAILVKPAGELLKKGSLVGLYYACAVIGTPVVQLVLMAKFSDFTAYQAISLIRLRTLSLSCVSSYASPLITV